MTQTEWIISIDNDLKDFDEMFVGNVRDGEVLIRCKDCEYWSWEAAGCKKRNGLALACTNDFCSRAVRKEE